MIHRLLNIISSYKAITKTITQRGISLDGARAKLLLFLVYEALSRTPFLAANFRTSKKVLHSMDRGLGEPYARVFGYLFLLTSDGPIDRHNLTKTQIYDQLARCFIAFLSGFQFTFPYRLAAIQRYISQLIGQAKPTTAIDRELIRDLKSHFIKSRIFANPQRVISLDDLLYGTREAGDYQGLNISIIAAFHLGELLKRIHEILFEAGFSERHRSPTGPLKWQVNFILHSLAISGFAQANTPFQREKSDVSWQRYLRIAYWKSNPILDIGSAYRSPLNPGFVRLSRFGNHRFCEQIYLDDINDLGEDSNDQILNSIHIFFIEKGKLAGQLLSLIKAGKGGSHRPWHSLWKILQKAPMNQATPDGIFCIQNARVRAERDAKGSVLATPENIEVAIREIFARTPGDMSLPLVTLLEDQVQSFQRFNTYWRARNSRQVVKLLIGRSEVDFFIAGFRAFLRRHRSAYCDTGALWYYCLSWLAFKNAVKYKAFKGAISFENGLRQFGNFRQQKPKIFQPPLLSQENISSQARRESGP